ncbi:MAG: biotin/lipoyl-binding protein, partial [Chloroflexota bacterium]
MARGTSVVSPARGRAAVPRTLIGAAIVVVIVAILGVTGVLAQAKQLVPGLRPAAPTYQSATVGTGNVQVSVIATGPVSTTNDLPLTFKESGKLATVKVNVGDPVSRGEVLATLN